MIKEPEAPGPKEVILTHYARLYAQLLLETIFPEEAENADTEEAP